MAKDKQSQPPHITLAVSDQGYRATVVLSEADGKTFLGYLDSIEMAPCNFSLDGRITSTTLMRYARFLIAVAEKMAQPFPASITSVNVGG